MDPTLPPLPAYRLEPLPPLVPGIPDKYLSMLILVALYWLVSLFFHIIDELDLFPQYRLHTPEEVLKRNHVSRWEVLKDVILQQVIQTVFGIILGTLDPDPMFGKEEYDIAVWAQRLRLAQHALPSALAFIGLDAFGLSKKLAATHPILSGVLAGGQYNAFQQTASGTVPAFMGWELIAAKGIYHLLIPALQFISAIIIVDTWQYFWHRAMHMNKWLYTQFHSRHHRLYVPYAYGALYNHPVEGFILDTLGAGIAFLVTGMTCRQGMVFFGCSTVKTVDDHCGYALPFDPLQHLTSNNAGYHDIHHQSWGIKTNFSQPFFTFWDGFLGTKYKGDTSLRYERDRKAMERRTAMEQQTSSASIDTPVKSELTVVESIEKVPQFSAPVQEDSAPEERVLRRSPRKKTPAVTQTSGSFTAPIKELRSRMNTSLHGKASGVLGVESSH
ncbi:sphingolipid C4-hydroxylase SUR2 [Myriangium duriaei CBS 260.36]|uniref:Sphingolipid C4-hydroxylase SUR2 n=1 Tax=Myriangium duriaei CBS 260.36 TaxID=1168546 RepID=A0A9P4J032_9PEZI|nr:sphingolipid C4-hydroxylase SUR2 [Myriangium duriaei CBS 260.36]